MYVQVTAVPTTCNVHIVAQNRKKNIRPCPRVVAVFAFKIGPRGASHQRSSFGGGSGGTSREEDFVLGRAIQFTGTHLGRWEICVGN